jgi:hypothetical protein
MHHTAIRHLAACEGPLLAAALFESTVQIWNWVEACKIGEFETILDFGGRRLALATNGSICITGSWTRGLAAYGVPDGKLLWHRRDFSEVQHLTLSPSEDMVYCGFERHPLAVVDADTGRTVDVIEHALSVVCCRQGRSRLIEERGRYRIEGSRVFNVPPISALVDVALSPDAACLCESNDGTRCIDLNSGELLWHHQSLSYCHATFNYSDWNFYCAAATNASARDWSLIRLAPRLLDCDRVARLGPCFEAIFARSGELLITRRGEIYETSTGRMVFKLNFPEQE